MTRFTARKQKAIALLRKYGRLERYEGGYWGVPGCQKKQPDEWVGTVTIQALYNARLVDVLCRNGSYNWDGRSAPRVATPTQKLIKMEDLGHDPDMDTAEEYDG